MLVLVCGGREWSDWKTLRARLSKLDADDVVMHGDCRGADKMAGWYWLSLEREIQVFPAQWEKFGRRAGYLRNQEMLDQNPDLVIAFHHDIEASKGTQMMVALATAKGTNVEVHTG